jgi:hypothetical protein
MKGLEGLRPPARISLRRRLAAWSDGIEPEAVRLVEQYRDLLPKRITNAQLSGLENVVGQASSYQDIRAFLDNRATRADRAGRLDVAGYWKALTDALNGLKKEAEHLAADLVHSDITDRERKLAMDDLHVRLVREYVQHLAAHSLYLGGLDLGEGN